MRIVSTSENKNLEKRVAITPEIAKKYISLGFDVSISKNYGTHLGFDDKMYSELGVEILESEKNIFEKADIIIQLSLPSEEKLLLLKENQSLIGVLNPYQNNDKLDNLVKKKNK